jgi:hypothetical protein
VGSGKEEEIGVAVFEALPLVRVVEIDGGRSARVRAGGEGASRLRVVRSWEREVFRSWSAMIAVSGLAGTGLAGTSLVSFGVVPPSFCGIAVLFPFVCLDEFVEVFWERAVSGGFV